MSVFAGESPRWSRCLQKVVGGMFALTKSVAKTMAPSFLPRLAVAYHRC